MASDENMVPESTSVIDNSSSSSCDSTSKSAFRVRNVSEINEAVQNSTDGTSSPPKRKLPAWLSSPKNNSQVSNTKRYKANATAAGESSSNLVVATEEITSNLDSETSNQARDRLADDANDVTDMEEEPAADEASSSKDACQLPSNAPDAAVDMPTTSTSSSKIKTEIKDEPCDSNNEASSSTSAQNIQQSPVKPVKVKKEEASSTTRETCKFGIRCYRRNPMHRSEMAHPGDNDYCRPDFPDPPKGTPDCPFGNRCYRRNPVHFQQFAHPPSTDPEKNWKERLRRLKRKKNNTNTNTDYVSGDDLDDYDLDDPFIDDASSDEYQPGNSDYDTDTEFENSQKT